MPLMGRENKMKTSILLNKGRCAALQLRMETNESTSTAKFYSKLSQQAALHVRTIQLAIQIESLTFN